jgi:LacI family transcriptional regulator
MTDQASPPSQSRPTLRSIAYLSGLGVSTVSRALRDDPDISKETRHRIQAIATQIGYRPNRAGVRLRTGKTNVIALVLNPQDDGSGFFANMVYGISEALAGTAYHLVVTPYSLSDPMSPLRYIVETNSADGIIISRMEHDDPRVRYLTNAGMPFVTHGRTNTGTLHCYVDHDSEAYARKALELLKARGRRRIALISPPPALTYYTHMLQGFETGLKDFGMAGFTIGGVSTDSTSEELRHAATEMAQRAEPPDGIISASTAGVVPIIVGLAEKGLALGQDYDVVAKPGSSIISLVYPGIITMKEDFRQAGHTLATMLLDSLKGKDPATLYALEAPALEHSA